MLSWIHLRRERWRIDASVLDPAEEWDLASVCSRICAIRGHSTMMTLSGRAFSSSYRERQVRKVFEIVLSARQARNSAGSCGHARPGIFQADIPTAAWEPFVLALVKALSGQISYCSRKTHTKKPAVRYWRLRFAGSAGDRNASAARSDSDEMDALCEGRGRRAQSNTSSLPRFTRKHARLMSGVEGGPTQRQIPSRDSGVPGRKVSQW